MTKIRASGRGFFIRNRYVSATGMLVRDDVPAWEDFSMFQQRRQFAGFPTLDDGGINGFQQMFMIP